MKTTSKKGIFPVPVLLKLVNLIDKLFKKKKTSILWSLFMAGVQLSVLFTHKF